MPRERMSRRQWEDPTAHKAIKRVCPETLPEITIRAVRPQSRNIRIPAKQLDSISHSEQATPKADQTNKSNDPFEAPVNFTVERRRREIEYIMQKLQAMRLLGLAGTGDYVTLGNKLRSIQQQQAEEVN